MCKILLFRMSLWTLLIGLTSAGTAPAQTALYAKNGKDALYDITSKKNIASTEGVPVPAIMRQMKDVRQPRFEENKGQITGEDASKVRYSYRSGNLTLFVLNNGLAYQFARTHYPKGYKHPDKTETPEERKQRLLLEKQIRTETYRMDIRLAGANPNATITTEGKSSDYTRYYNHNATQVYGYEKIIFHDIYPNIDWVIYTQGNAISSPFGEGRQGAEGEVKYDFIIRPSGNPADIRLQPTHVEELKLQADGSLYLGNRLGSITEQTPVSYQAGKTLATRFVQDAKGLLGFSVDAYDSTQPLTIDPFVNWATYYGGGGAELAYSCAVDASGNIYLAGYTSSTSAIASGGHQNTYGGGNYDAFLVKFDGNGTRLWSTYYGGSGEDVGRSCTVDAAGNVYLTGYTSSTSGIAWAGIRTVMAGELMPFW